MEQGIYYINALSTLVIVCVIAFAVVASRIEALQQNKLRSMKALAKKAHVDFCEEFGYNSNTAISVDTARDIILSLSKGYDTSMAYLRSADPVFNKDKHNDRP